MQSRGTRTARQERRMVMYQRLGEVPPKRHTQLWRDGRLLTEQVVGVEGFSGASSILYHLNTPVRVKQVGDFHPIRRQEWVPDAHVHHLLDGWDVEPYGDAVTGRRLLLWNQDVEIALCRPEAAMDAYYRNGEGDEVIFVHEGAGTVETILGDLAYRPGDYIVVPRGMTYRFAPEGPEPQRYVVFTSPGLIEIPRRYRNEYGQLLEHAPFSNRDLHGPGELKTHDEEGEYHVTVRVRDGYQGYVLDYHPFDVVGWDGYLYPYTFNIHDFEPITKQVHAPPPVHQTFAGRNFVLCSFCPRPLDWHERSVPIPYNHANLNSEEMIYYVSGNFGSRKAVGVGSITLHPSGVPHGPQPGLAEQSLGARSTDELAVMCDTFHPLRLSTFARTLDRPSYAYSWYDQPADREADRPAARSGEGLPSIP
jgi:homogentisate 1,2-dioxygenase